MCQGAAISRKTMVLEMGRSCLMRVRTAPRVRRVSSEVGEDDEDGEDDADQAFGEDVQGAAGGEGAAEEGLRAMEIST